MASAGENEVVSALRRGVASISPSWRRGVTVTVLCSQLLSNSSARPKFSDSGTQSD